MEPVSRLHDPDPRPLPTTPSRDAALDAFLDNWIVQARKGLLELGVLTALEGGEHYGYQIVRELSIRPTLGGAEGTIYPMLARLEERGLLSSTLRDNGPGPNRKYYRLTDSGALALTEMRARFDELIGGVRHSDTPRTSPLRRVGT